MRIAIDTGGTFTDCVYSGSSGIEIRKLPSTPLDPGEALLRAVAEIAPQGTTEVRHGTTVGTNTLLERKGARVAYVTTSGFEDTIEIGRQARPKLYDLFWKKELPLAPAELRFGVAERVGSDGKILLEIFPSELKRLKEALHSVAPEAVALSLLFSFANPANERAVAEAIRELDLPVSVSHEILPEFREYERGSTVLINAYLAPKMQRYLERIDSQLRNRGTQFNVMQSSGGIISAQIAAREPVRTILSGPAGGVIGAMAVAKAASIRRILTFDMGGTSTDVALIDSDAGLETSRESLMMNMPVSVPMLKIHTVGAGGGSIASFDRGGALRVGPESAGADPGPVCYGRGDSPTVTDANLLLGRLDLDSFLNGSIPLDLGRVRERFLKTKGPLSTVEQFAEGIIRVADSHMEKALRRVSIEQGHDPRDFVLLSFGGAGPLHAVALARSLRIPRVLVPNIPGALSAFGILVSDSVKDYSRTVMLRPGDPAIETHFRELEGLGGGMAVRSLDIRYAGQGYELNVPWSSDFAEAFHRLHETRYGYADRQRALEIVNARVRKVQPSKPIADTFRKPDVRGNSLLRRASIYFDGQWRDATIHDRERLGPGIRVSGAALIVEYSATTFLPPGSTATVDANGNLAIEVNA